MKTFMLAAALFVVGASWADEMPAPKRVVVLKSSAGWDGTGYVAYPAGTPELNVIRLTLPPHAALPWHAHPVPGAIYVLSGVLTIEKQGSGEKVVVKAGQAAMEAVDAIHRGMAGDEPVEAVVFFAGVTGAPVSK